jgi:4-aminobutyrate aminotransferase
MALPGPKAKNIIARDQTFISPSYPRYYPFVMGHGKGAEVWDIDGNRFLDFAAGIAVSSTGHSHPKVVKAIQEQAEKFIHISSDYYHPLWVKMAEQLDRISPIKSRTSSFMTNSGTEAIESAIKLARYFTGRTQFLGFLGAFHGRTLGAVTFTSSKALYHQGFYPLMNGVVHIPFPNPYRPLLEIKNGEDIGTAVIRYITDEIFEKLLPPEDVAGILVEPIQGEGGYILPPDSFYPALREICDKHGILLILDEVQSGMGRTGKWWAIEHYDVEPDILCTAKGIASGMPMGAMLAKKQIMNWPKGSHGNTFGGNPLACAAALATIELLEDKYINNAYKVGKYALSILNQIKDTHSLIGDVRGKGLMIGVEFVQDPILKTYAPDIRDAVVSHCFQTGLLTLGCGNSTIRITPPLCISKTEIEQGLDILEKAIKKVEEKI